MKKIISMLSALALVLTMVPAVMAETTDTYIPGTAIDEEKQGPTEYVEPRFYPNGDGEPTIGVTLVGVIMKDGKYFKDSDNDGELDPFEDWRLGVDERVADLLPKLTIDQRMGLLQNQLFCSPVSTKAEDVYDENGKVQLDKLMNITPDALNMYVEGQSEEIEAGKSFAERRESSSNDAAAERRNSTGEMLTFESRSGVLRANPDVETAALWTNSVNMVAEYDAVAKSEPTIPFTIISNPINAAGIPASPGVASAAMADGNYDMILKYAQLDGKLWDLKGISRMYGPQIDLVTDPRWNRNRSTYTERPDVNAGIAAALVKGYQGDEIADGSVLLFIKHFPGDGAAYNGFESHNKIGEWRLYPTEGSLEKYQIVGFKAAIDAGAKGVMPGYSRPANEYTGRSAKQVVGGVEINAPAVANAYNKEILGTLLHDVLGFDGMINTDSGVMTNGMQYGMEEEETWVRAAALVNGGSDVIGDQFSANDYASFRKAYDLGLYEDGALDRANGNTLKICFEMGQFDNPYTDVAAAKAEGEKVLPELQAVGAEISQKSVVLLKNTNSTLPLGSTDKRVYVASFTEKGTNEKNEDALKTALEAEGFTIVKKASEADLAVLDVAPGGIANSNKYMNVVDLVDGLEVDEVNYPVSTEKTGAKAEATTLMDVKKIPGIYETVHASGGNVVCILNCKDAWVLTNLEPYCDAIVGQFDTGLKYTMNVIMGRFAPVGKLPVSMISCNEVVATVPTEIGGVTYDICVAPNDVPGYTKDEYIDKEVLAQSPSGSYVYKDTDGNLYVSGFGLTW